MSRAVYPVRVFVLVAAVIALAAFGIGQVVEGAGMVFVLAASTLWTAFVVRKAPKGEAFHG